MGGRTSQAQPADVVNVSNVVTVLAGTVAVLRHGVPVRPGVGHVVDELEDGGQDGRQEEERGRGREGRGEAEEPDGPSEPGGEFYDEVLTGTELRDTARSN